MYVCRIQNTVIGSFDMLERKKYQLPVTTINPT